MLLISCLFFSLETRKAFELYLMLLHQYNNRLALERTDMMNMDDSSKACFSNDRVYKIINIVFLIHNHKIRKLSFKS